MLVQALAEPALHVELITHLLAKGADDRQKKRRCQNPFLDLYFFLEDYANTVETLSI